MQVLGAGASSIPLTFNARKVTCPQRAYRRGELVQLLKEAGFARVSFVKPDESGFHMTLLVAVKPLEYIAPPERLFHILKQP